jgi:hypothetical protein
MFLNAPFWVSDSTLFALAQVRALDLAVKLAPYRQQIHAMYQLIVRAVIPNMQPSFDPAYKSATKRKTVLPTAEKIRQGMVPPARRKFDYSHGRSGVRLTHSSP